eukprot:scaffold268788_cov31-Tisochrysis_lutea.AAC.5
MLSFRHVVSSCPRGLSTSKCIACIPNDVQYLSGGVSGDSACPVWRSICSAYTFLHLYILATYRLACVDDGSHPSGCAVGALTMRMKQFHEESEVLVPGIA